MGVIPRVGVSMPTRGKLAITFVLLLAAVAYFAFVVVHRRYRLTMNRAEDVYTALVYFLEANSGSFPTTEQQLTNSAFIERLPDGGYVVRARPESRWRPKTYGEMIRDFGAYHITWGVDLNVLHVDAGGGVQDATGHDFVLMRCPWPGASRFERDVTRSLVELAKELRGQSVAP